MKDIFTLYQVPPKQAHENHIADLSQNSASYAATQMESAYLGTIKQHFGRKFREAINYTVDIKNLERQLRGEMVGRTTRQKKVMVSQLLRQLLKQFREALENAIVNHDGEIFANVAQDNIFARHWDSLTI